MQWAWRETRDRLPMDEIDKFVRQAGFQPMSDWMKKSQTRKVSRPKAVAAEALEEDHLIDEPAPEVAKYVPPYVPKGPVERPLAKQTFGTKIEKDDEGLSPTDKQALYHLLK